MGDLYWIGGSSTWNTGTTKWSTSSGGSSAGVAPTTNDDVHIDAGSGAVTVTLSGTRSCRTINFTGFTGTFAFGTGTLSVGNSDSNAPTTGSITFVSGMTVTNTSGTLNFTASAGLTNCPIITAGKTMPNITLNGGVTNMQLQDTMTCGTITDTNGAIELAGNTLNCTSYTATASGAFQGLSATGGGTINLNGTGTVWDTSASTVYANQTNLSTATVNINDTSATAKTFSSAAFSHKFNLAITAGGSGSVTLNTSTSSFANFTINAPKTVVFTSGMNLTCTNLIATGSAGNTITISASTPGSAATITTNLTSTLRKVSCDYLSLTDSTAAGSAPFYAGSHSTNVSGNSGWIFADYPQGAFNNFLT